MKKKFWKKVLTKKNGKINCKTKIFIPKIYSNIGMLSAILFLPC